jgi:PAS domain S-box-containing protein
MCDLWEFAIEKVFIIGKPHGEVFKFAGVHGEVVLDWRLFPEMDAQGRVNSVLGVSRDITKLKKAEESLRETNEYLENLFDYANAPIIVWDPQFKITRFNHAFEYLTGYKEKDVIGQRLNILFPDESEEESLDKIERTLAGEFWESVEIPILRKDGIVRIALWNSANVLDRDNKTVLATIAQGIDITERKQAEEALHHSEVGFRRLSQEFNAILNTIPDSLTLLSSDLKVLWTNQGAASALGKDISEIVGQPCYKVWFNRSTPCLAETCPSVRSFHSGNPDGGNVSTPDGRLWDTRTFPIRGDDCKVFSVIKLDRDITEHRKLEEQLRQSQKMQAIGTLAGGVAHDFNNILTAVIGYAHVIQMKTKEGEPVRHYAEQILAASERAANLTQSLLAFGRKALMNPRPVNLNEIVRKVEKLLRRIIGEDIELKSILTAEELTIFADSGQIEQVIMNLAVNARDAMPHGGQLTINTSVITLNDEFIKEHGYGEAGKYAAFSVTDTGEGMDDSVREKIFEPFFTTKEVGKGTGLGLSMVYGIIKRHDGYINVYSMPKRGTTFLIYLPLIEAKAEAIERPAEPAPILRRSTETVLIAEDDGAARKYMADVLKQDGYKVIEAVDGKDAVNKFMDNKDKVQALLLDVVLPKKNGREVYEEISKINPGIKVLYMSGYTADIIHKHGIIDNGLNFISKPVSPTKLLKKMRELLDRTTS